MWQITVDHTYDPDFDKGPCVGVSAGVESEEPMLEKFRMYDDDNELYYEGIAHTVGFAPLDNFGMPNAGCTSIMWLMGDGHWETL